jgi:hypothetical protein
MEQVSLLEDKDFIKNNKQINELGLAWVNALFFTIYAHSVVRKPFGIVLGLHYSSIHDTTAPQPKSLRSFILMAVTKYGDIHENILHKPYIETFLSMTQSCVSLFFVFDHRYQKSLNRLLKANYVPATSAVLIAFFSSFFAAAINSTNEANKVACMRR